MVVPGPEAGAVHAAFELASFGSRSDWAQVPVKHPAWDCYRRRCCSTQQVGGDACYSGTG